MIQGIVLACVFGVTLSASLNTQYLPPLSGPSGAGSPLGAGPALGGGPILGGGQAISARFQGEGKETKILRLENEVNGDGSYKYAYETDDGTQANEEGHLNGESVEAQGSFSFTAPDGAQYSITYTAGENGFLPQGAHIPTAPPVPEEILKALEQNAADEARGIVDDGQYHPEPESAHGGSAVVANKAGNGGYKY